MKSQKDLAKKQKKKRKEKMKKEDDVEAREQSGKKLIRLLWILSLNIKQK